MKISIASGKGGTGKTTLSTNLAAYLAESGKVLLADLDVEEPNSGLFVSGALIHEKDMYKAIPVWEKANCTLCGQCQDVCNYNAVLQLGKMINVFSNLCHSCYACSELCPESALPMVNEKMGVLKMFKEGNLYFIESRLDIGEEQAVPLIRQTNQYVREHFEDDVIKLFDSPPGTSCPMIEAVKDTDIVILVTEPTPFGLHDLKLAVETVRELKKQFAVVINRDGIGNDAVQSYCMEEQIPIVAKIKNDRRIAELYSGGKLLFRELDHVKSELNNIVGFIRTYQSKMSAV